MNRRVSTAFSGRRSLRCSSALVGFLVTALAATACSGSSASPDTTKVVSTTTSTRPPIQPPTASPYRVGDETVTFVDHTRGTPAHGGAPATPYRSLSTYILYPAVGAPSAIPVDGAPPAGDGKPFPLIMFAHGLDSNGFIYRPLIQQWAAAGFVVVAPTFPLSSITAPGGATAVDDIDQPKDLSFVLTQVLKLSDTSGNTLSGMIDPRRIAGVGHSLGAMTVLAWTEDTCCLDTRVDAAVIIDGTEADFGNGTFFGGRTVPVLVLHGTADQTIPYANGKKVYEDAKAPKFLVSLLGAPHVSFLQLGPPGQKAPRWQSTDVDSVTDFLFGELDSDAAALAKLKSVADVPGLSTLEEDS